MKFTKLTLIALLMALLVCAFAACGGTTGTETNPGTDVTPGTDVETQGGTEPSGEHVHEIVERIDEPSCSERGYKREVCAICEEQFSVKPIDMVDHVAEKEVGCDNDAVCKFCGFVMATATGHKIDVVTESKVATATEAGYEKGKCYSCGQDITIEIAAGMVDTFDSMPTGVAGADAFGAGSDLKGIFTVTNKADGFEVVSENGNNYVKKTGSNAQLYYSDGPLDKEVLEFSFDFRLEEKCGSNIGLFSLLSGGKEMRVLNILQGGIYFGIEANGIVRACALEIGKWVNVKMILDTATFDYEVYVDGVKVLYTAADPENDGMHLVYVFHDTTGEFEVTAPLKNEVLHGSRSPFYPVGGALNGFYFFHYSGGLVCSFDNVAVRYPVVD